MLAKPKDFKTSEANLEDHIHMHFLDHLAGLKQSLL